MFWTQVDAGPGVQHPNGEGVVWEMGLPLQHGTQFAEPGVQAGQLVRICPPGTAVTVQTPGAVLQQPAPQLAVPGEQPAVQPVDGLPLHLPLASPQRQPDWAVPGGPANAHPHSEAPLTPQQPLEFSGVVQGGGLHDEEQCPSPPAGQTSVLHEAIEPPTLQFPPPWQQQQQPGTAPAPALTPQAEVENSAHAKFVGENAATAVGTPIE